MDSNEIKFNVLTYDDANDIQVAGVFTRSEVIAVWPWLSEIINGLDRSHYFKLHFHHNNDAVLIFLRGD